MSLIVAARFDSFPSAKSAAYALFAQGFSAEAVSIFYVNPPGYGHAAPIVGHSAGIVPARSRFGAIAGAALFAMVGALLGAWLAFELVLPDVGMIGAAAGGAYLGSLAGAAWISWRVRRDVEPEAAVRNASVLLTVQVEPEEERSVTALLRDADGKDVERANGRWTSGARRGAAKGGPAAHRPTQLQP